MKPQMTKLAAVAAIALSLAVGVGTATGATTVTRPGWEGLDGAGGSGNARKQVFRLYTDDNGTQRYGYMVGQYFVGFTPE